MPACTKNAKLCPFSHKVFTNLYLDRICTIVCVAIIYFSTRIYYTHPTCFDGIYCCLYYYEHLHVRIPPFASTVHTHTHAHTQPAVLLEHKNDYIRVVATELHPRIQYKTLPITEHTTAYEVVVKLVTKFASNEEDRDRPDLFYLNEVSRCTSSVVSQ